MEDLTGRLRQLERMELDLLDERKRIASQRIKEDENWAERLRQRDQEEAVGLKRTRIPTHLVD